MKKITILIIGIVVICCCFFYLIHQNNLLKTRFVLHAFGRYLDAYQNVEGKPVTSLSTLPDFHLISPSNSLQLKSSDLRSRVINGYFYGFSRLEKGKFVISASPLRLYFFSLEFGMLEDLNVRVNFKKVDSEQDSYDEVEKWSVIPEWFDLQSKVESG